MNYMTLYGVCYSSSFKDKKQIESGFTAEDIAQTEKKEFKDVTKQCKQLFGPDWGLPTFKKSQHPLAVIVNYN